MEWFFGILIENYVGYFLFWFFFLQIVVVIIIFEVDVYGQEVVDLLKLKGLKVEIDFCNEKINYKVCEYLLVKVLVIFVCGMWEVEECIVNIWWFGFKNQILMGLDEVVEVFVVEVMLFDLKEG